MKQIENFLDKNYYIELKEILTSDKFPWRIRTQMTKPPGDNIYFTYSFYNNFIQTSELHETLIIPILDKLNAASVIQVRANLALNELFDRSAFHTDYSYNSKTAILYFTTCDGGTEFKLNNKIKFIKAQENKIVIFNAKTPHRAVTSTDSKTRIILNFNYFEKN
jgi:hypothetical protein